MSTDHYPTLITSLQQTSSAPSTRRRSYNPEPLSGVRRPVSKIVNVNDVVLKYTSYIIVVLF